MGGGNMYFSEYNYDGSRKDDEVIGREPRPRTERSLDKEAQIKMLNELKSSIEAFKPCQKHIRNSSFDNGKNNGLSISSSLIDGMIAKINAG